MFNNCVPFFKCINKINNTQLDNAKDLDVVMPMYNTIEYNNSYAKASGKLWKYYRDAPNATILNHSNSRQEQLEALLLTVIQKMLQYLYHLDT